MRYLTKYDILFLCAVLVLSLGGIIYRETAAKQISSDAYLVVEQDNKVVVQKPLAELEGQLLFVKGPLGKSSLEIKHGKVCMKDSPCPDKLCVLTGWIDDSKQPIVCLPQRIVIRIESRKTASTYDGVTQ